MDTGNSISLGNHSDCHAARMGIPSEYSPKAGHDHADGGSKISDNSFSWILNDATGPVIMHHKAERGAKTDDARIQPDATLPPFPTW